MRVKRTPEQLAAKKARRQENEVHLRNTKKRSNRFLAVTLPAVASAAYIGTSPYAKELEKQYHAKQPDKRAKIIAKILNPDVEYKEHPREGLRRVAERRKALKKSIDHYKKYIENSLYDYINEPKEFIKQFQRKRFVKEHALHMKSRNIKRALKRILLNPNKTVKKYIENSKGCQILK